MARIRNNNLTRGLSGMVGGQMVFRTWNGKTYLSNAPSKPKKQSKRQKENRMKFKEATAFAKTMMLDPVKKAEYKSIADKLQLPNAYTAAITEYMRKPEIQKVDTSKYTGKEDEEIKVVVTKKSFEVQEVEVIIVDKNGVVIEEGKAAKDLGSEWIYRTKLTLDDKEGVQFLIRARERTGNFVEKRVLV
jgi:hypothetical protein